MQIDMFDKAIVDLRVVQVVNTATGNPVTWTLEFRFMGEDKWNPVKMEVYGIDMKEEENESGTGS